MSNIVTKNNLENGERMFIELKREIELIGRRMEDLRVSL